MQISLIGPVYPFRGGIAHSHALLGRALERAGHSVQVISFKRQYPAWLYPGQSDRDPSQNPIQIPTRYLLDPLYPWTWQKAVSEIADLHPDLVLIQWWTVFWAPALAWLARGLRRRGIRTAFFIHNVLPHEPRRLDPWLARLALRQGDAYLTMTERERQRLESLLPGLAKPVFTSPLPPYSLPSTAAVSKAEARARLRLPPREPVLLFFGLVRPYKGLRVLLEAFGQVASDPARPYLAIAGEFWEGPQPYRRQIEVLGLTGRVRVENRYLPDEEAALWFQAADLFIAPYVGGTQSAVLRVALSYGLPVIASDIIAGELSGLDPAALTVVPAGDTGALAEAIRRWLKDPARPQQAPSPEEGWAEMVRTVERLAGEKAVRR